MIYQHCLKAWRINSSKFFYGLVIFMLFNFVIGLVNSPSYLPGIIQESLDLNVVDFNEHLIASLLYDAEDLFIYHQELYGL